MKKVLALLFVVGLFTFVSCGSKKEGAAENTEETIPTEQTEAEVEEEVAPVEAEADTTAAPAEEVQ